MIKILTFPFVSEEQNVDGIVEAKKLTQRVVAHRHQLVHAALRCHRKQFHGDDVEVLRLRAGVKEPDDLLDDGKSCFNAN